MRELDYFGFLLCEFQARIFVKSLEDNNSSLIFLRRFKNSKIAKEIDEIKGIVWELDPIDAINRLNEEYEVSSYGQEKYQEAELFWMGYIYRYLCYTREISTKKAFQIIAPQKLRRMYYVYHTQSEEYVISSIFELSKVKEEELDKQMALSALIHNSISKS